MAMEGDGLRLAFGVKVYMYGATLSDATIGLYNDGADSYFRWTTQETSGDTTDTWAVDILSDKFASQIKKNVNVKRGGNLSTIGGSSITIGNEDKFWATIAAITYNGVPLNFLGLKCEVIEIDLDVADGGTNANETVIYTGTCAMPKYGQTQYTIPLRDAYEGRESNITKTENGNLIPVTFGTHTHAKFDRINESITTFSSGTITTPNNIKAWPIAIDMTVANFVEIMIDDSSNRLNLKAELDPYVTAGTLYIQVLEGTGSGQIRKVNSLFLSGPFADAWSFDLVDDVQTLLVGNATATASNQSWLKFVILDRVYQDDYWKGSSFNASDGTATSDIQVFTDEDSTFQRIPNLVTRPSGTDNNTIVYAPTEFQDNIDNAAGYHFYQPVDFLFTDSSTILDDWGVTNDGYVTNGDGIWMNDVDGASSSSTNVYADSANSSLVTDKNEGTFYNFQWSMVTGERMFFYAPFTCTLPALDSDIGSISSVYLLIKADWVVTGGNPLEGATFEVRSRSWIGDSQASALGKYNFSSIGAGLGYTPELNDFPDSYFSGTDIGHDFFLGVEDAQELNGYTTFDLNISSVEEYEKAYQLLFLFNAAGTNCDLKINEIAIMVKADRDIKSEIYSSVSGRVWDNSAANPFGEVGTDLIQAPNKILMHTKGLQNWTDYDQAAPTDGWGTDYPTSVNVNTTAFGNGSYIHPDLTIQGVANVRSASQILDETSGSTKAIAQSISKNFFLMNYINQDGADCIAQISRKTSEDISSLTIDLTDLMPNSLPKIVETDPRDIFCEVLVNFNRAGNGNYQNLAQVTQTSKALATEATKAAAVIGLDSISDADKADLWERGRQLYLRYGIINTPPKDMSDNKWIYREVDVFWYLKEWYEHQGAITVSGVNTVAPKETISFTVPYETARTDAGGTLWDLGTRINVNFPNVTNGVTREMLITDISRNLGNNPTCAVSGILYDTQTADDSTVFDSYATGTNWADSYATGDNKADEI